MMRTTCLLVAFGVTLGACSGSKSDIAASSGGRSGAPAVGNTGGLASGGLGEQGMGGSSGGGLSSSTGGLASSGAPSNGGSVALTGGATSGGASPGGNSSSAGATSGGVSSGGKAGNAGATSGGASSGGKAGNAGATSGGVSSGGGQGGDAGSGGVPPQACAADLSRANRTLVAQAIDELFVEKDLTAIDRYWSDPYLQHNPVAKSGVATFRSVMGSFVPSASFQYERLVTLADCELVVVYGRYSQTGLIFDMFRVQNGKIMEHWDSDANQASGATGIDPFDDTAPTAEHRALFGQFAATVLVAGERARAVDYLSTTFIEHRETTTGPSAFTSYLMRENVSYTKVHHVIADGNYVFALSEGRRGSTAYGFCDLFRVEAGKLAEHWDSRRPVPSSTMSGLGIF